MIADNNTGEEQGSAELFVEHDDDEPRKQPERQLPFKFYTDSPLNIFKKVSANTFTEAINLPIPHDLTNEFVLSVCFFAEKRNNIVRLNSGSTTRRYQCKCPVVHGN